MKVIISGCGKVGEKLVAAFTAEGYDVTALDVDASVVSDITNVHDAIGAVGNCVDCEVLDSAGVSSADLFVALTGSDELNMLSCFLAKRMGAGRTIARIRNPEYNDESLAFLKNELDLAMAINPDSLAAREIFDILKVPSAGKLETFNGKSFEMLEMKLKDQSLLDGKSLKEIREEYKSKVLICAVQRGSEVYIPGGDFILRNGDKIGITAAPSQVTDFLKKLGVMKKQARDVMIVGGSRTAFYLAKLLIKSGTGVKIIEQNPSTAAFLSEQLPEASIILGDGAKQDLLIEEGINEVDALLALTGIDEENILIAKYAETQNVPKVVAKVNRQEFESMAEKIGVDCVISPKKIVADVMIQYARALDNSKGSSVEALYKLMDEKVEALEFSVKTESKITGKPLKELSLKKNILIAGIIRNRKIIVPGGEDVILPGDRVIILAGEKKLRDISEALAE